MSPLNYLIAPSTYWTRLIVIIVFILSFNGPVVSVKNEYFPPSLSQLRRNFFENKLAFITVGSVWIFFLIVFIIFRLYYLDERSKLHQVFDDCSPSTVQHKYLIRLRIGKSSSIFQRDTSAIMFDLLDPRNCFITRLSVSPSWLKVDVYSRQIKDKPKLRSLKFLLNRANQLPTISAVRVAHDSYFPVGGYIFLHSMEIRNLTENILTQIPIFKRIYVLPPDAGEMDQVFHARLPSTDKKKNESRYSSGYAPYLTFSEVLLFIFFYSNMTLFTTLIQPNYLEITNFSQAIYNGIYGVVPSIICTGIFLLFYRFYVKIFYSRSKATGSWPIIRIIFLFTLTINGLVVGLTASLIQSRQTANTLTFWSLAIVISNLSLGTLCIPIIIVGYAYSIFKTSSQVQFMMMPTLSTKAIDEMKLVGQKSSIIGSLLRIRQTITSSRQLESMVDENSKNTTSGFQNKSSCSEVKQHKTIEEDVDNSKLQQMIVQKQSMEEGLAPDVTPVKSARDRIISRIHQVIGRRSKEPKSAGEEKIFDIDKRIENQST